MSRAALLALPFALALACRNARPVDAGASDLVARDVVAARDVPQDAPQDVPSPDVPVDAGARPRRVVVTLTGDILLHRAVLETFEDHRAQGGLAWSLNWLSALIAPREVSLTWLATPLTDAHRPAFSGAPAVLGAPRAQAREIARDLGRVGLDGVCLATQHAFDQMAEGLSDTADALRAANLGVAGVGDTEEASWQPWITERDGVRVAFLCFTQRTWQSPSRNPRHIMLARTEDPAPALAAVTAAREHADIVVAGVQWSRNPFRPLTPEQRELARSLVAAGADLVVGTGVAAVAPIERVESPRGEALIAWSMGSLLSNHGSLWRTSNFTPPPGVDRTAWDPTTRDVALVRAQFDLGDAARLRVVTLTANGLWTQHAPEGLRVIPLRSVTDYDLREARARALGASLGPNVTLRQ